MEKIGDKEAAIAERVRALLAAANNTAAAVAAVPAASPAVPAVVVPRDPRRLDPGADPARVVANLTAAGIQLAVSKTNSMYIHHYFGSEFRNKSGLSGAESTANQNIIRGTGFKSRSAILKSGSRGPPHRFGSA